MNHRLIWALRRGKGQTLALGPRLFHTALCANPQSVAQSDLSGNGVVHTAQLSGIVMKLHAVKVKTFFHCKNTGVTSLNTSPIICNSHPEVNHKGVWVRLWCIQPAYFQWVTASACSLKDFNWPPAPLPPALQRVNHSLWTYCLREVFIASSCVENLILLPVDRYEEYKCLISSDGGNELVPSQSVYHWQGGKRGHFTILSTWGHVIDLPSSAVRSRFIIKPLQLWSTINSPDWPRVTKCTTNNLGTNILVFCQ